MEFFKSIGGFIMTPLYFVITAVLLGWHEVWSLVFDQDSGWAWALSIVGLTVVIRALLIPLFVKQIKSSRNMQLLQPQLKALREKYGHDRERFAQEQMKLFKDTKTNPLSSCLPILIQMPIFFALFRVLDRAAKETEVTRGLMTVQDNIDFGEATLLGAKLSDTFIGTEDISVRILAAVLVLTMTATTFLTQRQLMSKNMPADALTGPYAQQQKLLLYVLPVVFAVGGIAFPIGVILYWTTSNLWTMGQQFYVIRNNPAPNTEAAAAKEERDKAKRAKKGLPPLEDESPTRTAVATDEAPRPSSRQQPRNVSRAQRKKQGGKQPQRPRTQSDPRPESGTGPSGSGDLGAGTTDPGGSS
ncbi:membrane protein insertase YidC [Nocardioides aequoreus]|uniref:membrane protein insertase YidC n=1 Tax=Nocardioides aequoreus TaxID=397278 RepID=UPI000A9889CA|nr:membrane protein insertase YidC [Nocardioides aequoreus]